MTRTFGAVILLSCLSAPLAAQAPDKPAQPAEKPAASDQAAVPDTVKGPRLDSPDLVKLGKGVSAPRLLRDVKPTYPASAMKAKTQGMVTMECVVLTDGTVGDVRVSKSLDPVLDEEALRTLRQWTFHPATVDGKAVAVKVDVEMSFTLRTDKKDD